MVSNTAILPNNVEKLIGIIVEKDERLKLLEEHIRLLKAKLFGPKSEKISSDEIDQLLLFNEAELITQEPESETSEDKLTIPEHDRKKRGRKPLPENLPRVEVIHDLKAEEKICECGCQMSRIGEDISEKLDIIPAKAQVIKHIRYKYTCTACEGIETKGGTVKIAPAHIQLIPKSIATAGLLAYIITSKFVDALPLYRQEKMFARIGVDISRASMANWMIKIANKCEILLTLLHHELLSGPLINIDETPVQVLNEPGRKNTTKSYMWIFRGGSLENPILIYKYKPTRSGEFLNDYLDGYEGHIQTDGYIGYDYLKNKPATTLLGCFAHSRRKFMDVVKVQKKDTPEAKSGNADIALNYIKKLYNIEHKAKYENLSFDQIYELRQEQSKPILDEFKIWLDNIYPKTPPKGLLGKAISYTLNQWDKLTGYIEKGYLKPDNNLAENAVRPFVVGRKNWLFSGHPNGANASACLYSLIETAKANNLEPYKYFRLLLEKLPFAETEEDYKKLLPQYIEKENSFSNKIAA